MTVHKCTQLTTVQLLPTEHYNCLYLYNSDNDDSCLLAGSLLRLSYRVQRRAGEDDHDLRAVGALQNAGVHTATGTVTALGTVTAPGTVTTLGTVTAPGTVTALGTVQYIMPQVLYST